LSIERRRVLEHLERGEAYGLDLVNAGVLSRSSCYVHLASMENDDLIVGTLQPVETEGSPPRRQYTITDRGRAALVEARLPKARQV
jgi:DNA-binding PadR family transcriptional regulator